MQAENNESPLQQNSKWDDSEFHSHDQSNWVQRHKLQALLLLLLSLLVLAVVLWLPKLVEPVTAPEPVATDNRPLPPASNRSNDSADLESPWEQAQVTRARRQAQEILAKLVDRQNRLEKLAVNRWAEADFAAAKTLASEGDQLYTRREFAQAQQGYQNALQQMDELVARSDSVLQGAIVAGNEQLRQQNSELAAQQFSLALAIAPDSEAAITGMQRAEVLDELLQKLDAAENLRGSDLDAALTLADEALKLDAESRPAQEMRSQLLAEIRERDYSIAMGDGIQALQRGDYALAIKRFQRAQTTKPGDADAARSLTSARHRATQANIETLLGNAARYEQEEQWQQALQNYEKVQALDANLVEARVGTLRSGARLDLDKRLQKLIDEPLRLGDSQVLAEAETVLRDARQVNPSGTRIASQTRELQAAIAAAQMPVSIRLQSDNKTQVTLYRVGNLGSFSEHSLDLTPGHYTLVGNRRGYRDVREEFTVEPGIQSLTIVIQCTEKVSLDG